MPNVAYLLFWKVSSTTGLPLHQDPHWKDWDVWKMTCNAYRIKHFPDSTEDVVEIYYLLLEGIFNNCKIVEVFLDGDW